MFKVLAVIYLARLYLIPSVNVKHYVILCWPIKQRIKFHLAKNIKKIIAKYFCVKVFMIIWELFFWCVEWVNKNNDKNSNEEESENGVNL